MISSSFLSENFTSKDNLSTFDDDACLELINVNDSLISIEKKLNAIDEFKLIYDGLSDIQKYGEDNDITNDTIDILSEKLGCYSIGFEGLKEFLKTMWDKFIEFLKSIMKNIGEFFTNIVSANDKNKEKMDKAKKEFNEALNKKSKQKSAPESDTKKLYVNQDFSNLTSASSIENGDVYRSIYYCFKNLLELNTVIFKDRTFIKIVNKVVVFIDKIATLNTSNEIIKYFEIIEREQYEQSIKISKLFGSELYQSESFLIPKSVRNRYPNKNGVYLAGEKLPGNMSFYLLANKEGNLSDYKYFLGEHFSNNKAGKADVELFDLKQIESLEKISYRLITDIQLAREIEKDIKNSAEILTKKMDDAVKKISSTIGDENQSNVTKKITSLLRYSTNTLIHPCSAILKFNITRSNVLVNFLTKMYKIYEDNELS